jgi:ATP-binding cassette, subfamily C (CFTR/MRP), member 1
MDDGEIIEKGSFDELNKKIDGNLSTILNKYSSNEDEIIENNDLDKPIENEKIEKKQKIKKLMSEEERVVGTISYSVLIQYINLFGGPLIIIALLFMFVIAQIFTFLSDWWLSMWTTDSYPDLPLIYNSLIFLVFSISGVFLIVIRNAFVFILGLVASTRLHQKAIKSIFNGNNIINQAPISFFDSTPLGRIISRFSKDQEICDSSISQTILQFLSSIFNLFSILVMIIYVNWIFIFPFIPIFIIYLIILQVYRSTSRELKRIESISRSPLYSHFSESLNGISTIVNYEF